MKKISYQGERGAFSEIAAEKYFGNGIEFFPSYSFNDVFKKVKRKSVDFGIVPIENSLYGSVFETYDLLLKYTLKIQGELNLKINHALISDKRYKIPDIKHLYSHPQALGQCSEFLIKIFQNIKFIRLMIPPVPYYLPKKKMNLRRLLLAKKRRKFMVKKY